MIIEPKQVIENRYEIIEKLGEGGMGEVWKALDTNLGDEVVIKMPLNHLDADILRRFEREARSMRKHSLECPQILNIEDVGSLDGTPWYVMRYLGGGTVCDRALSKNDDGSVNWDASSFDWLEKIASALDYLHKENCFHRDVKPENILFSAEGTPYLVDFGIVKTVNETTSMMTEQGKTVGTMAYMAPEILDGGQFSAQSDQYSLAVTLYEFLTGERPFSGTTFFALFRSIQQGHRELSELHPAIPLAASQVVDRAFSSDPGERFSTCLTFVNAFLAGLQSEQTVQPPNEVPTEYETRELHLGKLSNALEEDPSSSKDVSAHGLANAATPRTAEPEIISHSRLSKRDRISPVADSSTEKSVRVSILIAGVLTIVSGIGIAYATGLFKGTNDRTAAETNSVTSAAISDSTPSTESSAPQTPEELFAEAEALLANSQPTASEVGQAIKSLKEAAFDDHLPSQKRLGKIYSEGEGVDQDYEEAFDWLRRAAGQGDAESQFYVGLSYAKGDIGVARDTKETIRWYQKSADRDFSPALVAIGMHYLRGDGIEKDLTQAKRYMDKAVANNFPPAQAALEIVEAAIEDSKSKPLSRLEELELAVEKGDADSQFELASAYAEGKLGLRKSSRTALKYFMEAAKNDHLRSQLFLAKGYDLGINQLQTSYTESLKWYQRAADQGDARAKRRSAELKSLDGKSKYLAEHGSAEEQYGMGEMFEVGRSGQEKSLEKAIRWYRLAAKQGSSEAKRRLKNLIPERVTNSIGMKFVHLEDGEFYMGSPKNEKGRNADENLHRVEIKRDLYVSQYEVTVAQFRRFIQETGHRTKAEKSGMGSSSLNPLTGEMYEKSGLNWQNPGYSISDNHPVSQISWEDANRFAVWLGKKEGKKYRLPTEAEWEYAARAGTKTTFSSGNSYGSLHGFANVSDQSRTSQLQPEDYADLAPFNDGYADASPVGSYRPNSLGLYDMHGNVWEWCYDTYHSNAYSNSKAQNPFSKKESEKRVMRGGCFM